LQKFAILKTAGDGELPGRGHGGSMPCDGEKTIEGLEVTDRNA
jgi:hypothetical protein